MKQYFDLKRKHADAILLFRVGDFYETFGEDAVKASQILGIVLTSRNNGGSDIELAGFPHHSLELYLPKLVQAGYRVAICEQMEKPSKEKKIVKRDVTEVVTPGVTTNDALLKSAQNNFLSAVYYKSDQYAVALLDISTGEFFVHEGDRHSLHKLLQSFKPKEIIYCKSQNHVIEEQFDKEIYKFPLDEWFFEYDYNRELLLKHFKVHSLKGFGIESKKLSQIAAGTIMHYLGNTQHNNLAHIHRIVRIESDKYMWLDKFTIRNLELVRSNHESGRSLLDVIDRTSSPMGARLLARWVVLPLKDIVAIKSRQDRVDQLINHQEEREFLIKKLKAIGDLERLSSKIPLRKINPKELVSVKNALLGLRDIKGTIEAKEFSAFNAIHSSLNSCEELIKLIEETLIEDAPYSISKANIIKEGWHSELDEWKSISRNSKEILLELQKQEAEKTGIASLKVGFNNVFGYYFEVTNKYKNQNLIPDEWVRKQTLKGSERYINDELKKIETNILQAEEKISELEFEIFEDLIDTAGSYITALLHNAHLLAELDCYISFAQLAIDNNYVRPLVDDSYLLDIKNGRHPVIETQLPVENPYVPNDVSLDLLEQQIILITGPNMSGKSAVLRQTALISLLAHMGAYVPAESARIGLIDKIFTRVGASDNISSGESTFMVEMNETASILNNLSKRSLVILDEIGRGTSTYDGISIAWAIAEYLHDGPGPHPKTLFATHYHELSALEDRFERVKNFNVSTREHKSKVIFLRKLVEGTCASSFGIHVAQMAGMPSEIVHKAKELLSELEQKQLQEKAKFQSSVENSKRMDEVQMQLFDNNNPKFNSIKKELDSMDITTMTPIECMLKLKEIKEKLEN